MTGKNNLNSVLEETARELSAGVEHYSASVSREEVGHVYSLGQGIVWAKGLEYIKSEELVVFKNGVMGVVIDILPERTGIVLLDEEKGLQAGDEVSRTHRILEVPVNNRNETGNLFEQCPVLLAAAFELMGPSLHARAQNGEGFGQLTQLIS